MKKLLKKLEHDYKLEAKKFGFWSNLAQKANDKAKVSAMRCKTISSNIEKLRGDIIDEVDTIVEEEL